MASLEYNCEALAIALLTEQAGLAGVAIVHEDVSTQTAGDRVVCKAMPREVYVYGKDMTTPKMWRVPVEVSIHLATNNVTTLDAWMAAENAAFSGSPSGAIVTLAGTLFPAGGMIIQDGDEGEHSQEPDERTRAKVWNFLTNA